METNANESDEFVSGNCSILSSYPEAFQTCIECAQYLQNLNDQRVKLLDCVCPYYPLNFVKEEFYLVSVFGTILATISIVNNSILLYLFMTRPYFRRSVFFYITVLAVLDVFHGIFYIMTMPVGILYQYTKNLSIQMVWHSYFVPVHTLSHIVSISATYLLVAASFERFLTANWMSGICHNRGRMITLLVLILFAIVSRGTIFFEYEIVHRPHCPGLRSYVVFPTDLKTTNKLYELVWTFWYRNLVSVFIPVTLLIVLNLGIVLQQHYYTCFWIEKNEQTGKYRLRFRAPQKIQKPPKVNQDTLMNAAKSIELRVEDCGTDQNCSSQTTANFSLNGTSDPNANGVISPPRHSLTTGKHVGLKTTGWISKARQRVRKAATRTLIAIVAEYLICNSLAVVLTLWEHLDQENLTKQLEFYTYASDTINLLTVISCTIRLPTYCFCDVTLRTELYRMLIGCFCKSNKKTKSAYMPECSSQGDLAAARNVLLRQRLMKMQPASMESFIGADQKMDFAALVLKAMEEKRNSVDIDRLETLPHSNFLSSNYATAKSFKKLAQRTARSVKIKIDKVGKNQSPDATSTASSSPGVVSEANAPNSFKKLAKKAAGQDKKPLTPFAAIIKELKAQKPTEEAQKRHNKSALADTLSNPEFQQEVPKTNEGNSQSQVPPPQTKVQFHHSNTAKLLSKTLSMPAESPRQPSRILKRSSAVIKQHDSSQVSQSSRKFLIRQAEVDSDPETVEVHGETNQEIYGLEEENERAMPMTADKGKEARIDGLIDLKTSPLSDADNEEFV